jgi:hypothetical protein
VASGADLRELYLTAAVPPSTAFGLLDRAKFLTESMEDCRSLRTPVLYRNVIRVDADKSTLPWSVRAPVTDPTRFTLPVPTLSLMTPG